MLWSNSRRDIETMTKLKVGERQAAIVQDYQTLCYVVSQALGGSTGGGSQPVDDGAMRPRNAAELASAMKQVFGLGETGGSSSPRSGGSRRG